jgi:hypothetical protein
MMKIQDRKYGTRGQRSGKNTLFYKSKEFFSGRNISEAKEGGDDNLKSRKSFLTKNSFLKEVFAQ